MQSHIKWFIFASIFAQSVFNFLFHFLHACAVSVFLGFPPSKSNVDSSIVRLRDATIEWTLKSWFTSISIYLLLLDKRRYHDNNNNNNKRALTRSTFNVKQFIDIMLRIISRDTYDIVYVRNTLVD